MVKFFSEKTGVKYPYPKYEQTTVHDFGGGMENITATTQTDEMIHNARHELDSDTDWLQSHELAHQWFGDYVTCRSWSDLWLNESFAIYFQAMWDEHRLGHHDFLYWDVKSNEDQYQEAWGRGERRPIVTKNYANPDAVFDVYAYQRGAAVLHMLRTFLGEGNWWRAINHYLTKYAHQPVETEQFRIAIEESTGQPMDWFFDEWLYRMGHPVFRVTQEYDATKKQLTLKVRQEQKPDTQSQYPQVGFFRTPVDIEIGTAGNTRIERVQIEAKEEQTFAFSVDSEPLLVNFDHAGTLIKELTFDKSTAQLVYQLNHDEDVLGRIWAISQLSARKDNDKTPPTEREMTVRALSDATAKDKFWGARFEAVAALDGVKEAKDALLAATKDPKARVRTRAVTSLSATKDPNLAETYVQLLNDPSYQVIRAAAVALGQTRSVAAYDPLLKLIDQSSERDTIRISGLRGLAALGDKRALDLGLKFAAVGNLPNLRSAALNLVGATGKDDSRAFNLLASALNEGVERQNFQLLTGAGEGLVALGDERGLAVLQAAGKKWAPQTLSNFAARLRTKLAATKPGNK